MTETASPPKPGARAREARRGPSPWRLRIPPVTTDKVMEGHDFDGIQEQDNQLPRWWLYILYATTVFALGYWFYYHTYRVGALPGEAYAQAERAARAAEAERAARAAVSPEALAALARDPAVVRQGRAVFAATCVPCHGANGGGTIGPNLTDNAWINGGAADRVFRTVSDGVLARGMPAWGAQLGIDRTRAVTAYVLTLRNTNVAGGKAAQGAVEP